MKGVLSQKEKRTLALVGNPNCGKTTLFNALTGSHQKVGNWPGVTVERKSGLFHDRDQSYELIDLPGIYALTTCHCDTALDESIACDFIFCEKADVIINVVDASHLERNLYLTLQLLEMGAPVILALTMTDVLAAKKTKLDIKALSQQLGCPVVDLVANASSGLETLKKAIRNYQKPCAPKTIVEYPPQLEELIQNLQNILGNGNATCVRWRALCYLEDGKIPISHRSACSEPQALQTLLTAAKPHLPEDPDILLADARYRTIEKLLSTILKTPTVKVRDWTSILDAIVLNRFLALPIFLFMMYSLFFFSINIGGAFQDFFDISSETIFVSGLSYALSALSAPNWLIVLLANGIGKGINTTITFIPVIGAMFFFLAFLEDCGYMARAAFVIDRLMRSLGLPGKAFIPMIVGFGCNVPAVMAARALESKRDRILTIMMSPFMSCGARLAIFAVFTAAFFPQGGQNIVFALYLLGIVMAVLTGFLLRYTVLKGEPSPLIMELPLYHAPKFKTLCINAWLRLRNFVFRAGKLIVPICVFIGALNAITWDGRLVLDGDASSILSHIGQWITPIFYPMGIHADNWPATVGLLTGILAKEVVVGTLNTLYTQIGQLGTTANVDFQFWGGMNEAFASIYQNFLALPQAFQNPVLAKAPIDDVSKGVYGLMYQKFDGKIGALAYLIFVLLYFPCVSTTAVMLKELNRAWSIFSVVWMTTIAYGTSVLFYQTATFAAHPVTSMVWILCIVAIFSIVVLLMQVLMGKTAQRSENAIARAPNLSATGAGQGGAV